MSHRNSARTAASIAVCLLASASAWAQKPLPGDGNRFQIHRDAAPPMGLNGLRSSDVPYHNEATLQCSDCHVMHASQQHNLAGGTGPAGSETGYPASFTPAKNLLRRVDPVDVCLACHDGRMGVPDVLGIDTNALVERSAGFFDTVETLNPRGHDLGRDLYPAPDQYCSRCHWDEQKRVTCIDCHDAHGNMRPRNLQWASYPEGTPELGLFNPPGMTGLGKYERANTAYASLDSSALREPTTICLDCHHVFSGAMYNDADGDGIHELHPSYDSERGDPNSVSQGAASGTTSPVHWTNGAGAGFDVPRVPFISRGAIDFASARIVSPSLNGVFCLSCHKAHGSSNAFGLVWQSSTLGVGPSGCDQCHEKTGY